MCNVDEDSFGTPQAQNVIRIEMQPKRQIRPRVEQTAPSENATVLMTKVVDPLVSDYSQIAQAR